MSVETQPWERKRSYSRRDHHRETYSKQDPEEFLKNNWGKKNDDGSWDIERNLILLRESPIVKNGRFIVKLRKIKGNFNCGGQSLVSLEGGPEYVGGNFWCDGNPRLRSLKHGPKYVGGEYSCAFCNISSLKSLEGVEYKSLDVSGNKIKNMKSFPKYIDGSLTANENLLESLEGMPRTKGEASFLANPLKTLYGFKIPTGNDIVRFVNDDEVGCNLTKSEIDFVMHQQYDLEKEYKNYYQQLFKRIIKKGTIEDLRHIQWPKKMLDSGKIQNVINSFDGMKKFNI